MIRVIIADDHPVVREGLRGILEAHPDLTVTADVADGAALVQAVRTTPADVVILDVSMPGPGFFETLKELAVVRPDLPVLVLSFYDLKQYAVRSLRAGAAGYLTKDSAPDQLAEAVRRLARGGRYVSPALGELLASAIGGGAPHEALSDREFQVLRLQAAGKSVKEMAAELSLSPKTVSTYRARILTKLAVGSHAEAIRYAVTHGLLD